MIVFILMTTFALGLSESIEQRLPEDPNMIYTVGFEHDGVKVGLDWQDRQILPERVCRKSSDTERLVCQQAAIEWLHAECAWYSAKETLTEKQEDMQYAVCLGADALSDLVSRSQLADR